MSSPFSLPLTSKEYSEKMKSEKLLFYLFFAICWAPMYAQIELPEIISDGMVLQRDSKIKIWGWATENEKVTLQFQQESFSSVADANGKWEIILPPQEEGGPYEMNFKGNNFIQLENIYFGDVWLCSGQSNMETTMERVSPLYPEETENSKNEKIRQFLVPDDYTFKKPRKNLSGGSWKAVNSENLPEFSAVAYFFAKKVFSETGVPIGIINSAVGGSPVEAWMSEKSLKSFPTIYKEHLRYQSDSLINAIEEENRKNSIGWNENLEKLDKGLQENYIGLKDFSNWKTTEIPGYWQENNMLNSAGVIWYKKEINLSEVPSSGVAELNLGTLIDSDQAYVNGELVGQTGYQYPPRRYTFNTELLKEGKNIITVRLVNNAGRAGFIDDKPYYLKAGNETIDLKGTWNYKIGATMPDMKAQKFVRWKPGGLYNAMIAPLHDYKIKGVLWYQGESNAGNPEMYRKLLPEMILDWRDKWNDDALPFLYVQLPNFMEAKKDPTESNWAVMREIQRRLKDSLPNTGMAVTIDIGEWNDIHPLNKKDVGERLALQAFSKVYHKEVLASSPEPKLWNVNKNEVFLHFNSVGEGLKLKNGKTPQEFALSEDGKNFFWAEAEIIDENTIKIKAAEVDNPKFVRYAWADNPDKSNLYNSANLPASPFEIRLN